jgi:hypothetical protein
MLVFDPNDPMNFFLFYVILFVSIVNILQLRRYRNGGHGSQRTSLFKTSLEKDNILEDFSQRLNEGGEKKKGFALRV